LASTIAGLSDDKMQQIADRVGEIIKDEYWSAVDTVLGRSFGNEEDEQDEDGAAELDDESSSGS